MNVGSWKEGKRRRESQEGGEEKGVSRYGKEIPGDDLGNRNQKPRTLKGLKHPKNGGVGQGRKERKRRDGWGRGLAQEETKRLLVTPHVGSPKAGPGTSLPSLGREWLGGPEWLVRAHSRWLMGEEKRVPLALVHRVGRLGWFVLPFLSLNLSLSSLPPPRCLLILGCHILVA